MGLLMKKFKQNLASNKDKSLAENARTFFAHKTGIDVFDWRNGKMLEDGNGKHYASLGIDEGSYTMILGRSGGGKAQPLYSNILTPEGWVKMGDIKVGSKVICPISGNPINVTEIHPQGIKENFRVSFVDGTSMECNDEHLFEVQYIDETTDEVKVKVCTLKDIQEDYILDNGSLKYAVPMTKAVNFDKRELEVSPFELGKKIANDELNYIPEDYKFTSVEDREELLKGIASNGVNWDKEVQAMKMVTDSEVLANDIKFLAQSLGAMVGLVETKNEDYKYELYIHFAIDGISPRQIDLIEKIGETEMQCIKVDSERHLYITDDFIVTHNTGTAIQMAANIVKPYENGLIHHFDIEQATEMSRVKKITRWTNEELENKYNLKNTGIFHETIMATFNELAHAKEELKDEIMVDTGKTDLSGQPIMIYPPSVFIIDSLAMLTSKEKTTEDLEGLGTNMSAAGAAKANASFFRQILPRLKQYNIHLIVINHIVDKIDINMYQPTKSKINYLGTNEATVGGHTPIYLAQVLLKVDPGKKLDEKEGYGIQGFMNNIHILKSRTNRAGQILEVVYDQDRGVDNIMTNYHQFKAEGLIGGAGRSFYLKANPEIKFSQKDFKKKLVENKDLKKAYAQSLKECYSKYINRGYDQNEIIEDEVMEDEE